MNRRFGSWHGNLQNDLATASSMLDAADNPSPLPRDIQARFDTFLVDFDFTLRLACPSVFHACEVNLGDYYKKHQDPFYLDLVDI